MTPQVAIEILQANYPDACYEQLREAVDLSIYALKQTGRRESGILTIMVIVLFHTLAISAVLVHLMK